MIARLLGLPIWQLLAGAALLGAAVGGAGAGWIVYQVQDARVLSCETAASSAALEAANFAAQQIEAAHRAAEDATVEALRRADVALACLLICVGCSSSPRRSCPSPPAALLQPLPPLPPIPATAPTRTSRDG